MLAMLLNKVKLIEKSLYGPRPLLWKILLEYPPKKCLHTLFGEKLTKENQLSESACQFFLQKRSLVIELVKCIFFRLSKI